MRLPCRVSWIDPRPAVFPSVLPANTRCFAHVDVADLPAGTRLLVMTHDHQRDFDIVSAALARGDAIDVGLIGSATKRARFAGRLRRLGFDDVAIGRLRCPIGIPGIGSKLPAAIAVSIAAELLREADRVAREPAAVGACLDCARHPEGVCA